MKKRILFIGDLHCGHRAGLTSPNYWTQIKGDNFYRFQIESWNWYHDLIKSIQPIDICVINGDAIDGMGERSGGTELITTDVHQQCKMAVEAIQVTNADRYFMTYGTPYHSGLLVDDELRIAEALNADIKSHQWITANGVTFDIKHFIAGTSVPYSKGTAIAKEAIWGLLWFETGEQPNSQIYIRSHVHQYFQGYDGDFFYMVLPALQGKGSKFGSRKCSNLVKYGLVYFDVDDDGGFTWTPHLLKAASQKQESTVV